MVRGGEEKVQVVGPSARRPVGPGAELRLARWSLRRKTTGSNTNLGRFALQSKSGGGATVSQSRSSAGASSRPDTRRANSCSTSGDQGATSEEVSRATALLRCPRRAYQAGRNRESRAPPFGVPLTSAPWVSDSAVLEAPLRRGRRRSPGAEQRVAAMPFEEDLGGLDAVLLGRLKYPGLYPPRFRPSFFYLLDRPELRGRS